MTGIGMWNHLDWSYEIDLFYSIMRARVQVRQFIRVGLPEENAPSAAYRRGENLTADLSPCLRTDYLTRGLGCCWVMQWMLPPPKMTSLV